MYTNTRFLLIMLLFFYSFSSGYTQVLEVITYDTTTNTFDKPLPFDKSSKVVFEGEEFKSVKTIWIYELFHRNGEMQLFKEKERLIYFISKHDTILPIKKIIKKGKTACSEDTLCYYYAYKNDPTILYMEIDNTSSNKKSKVKDIVVFAKRKSKLRKSFLKKKYTLINYEIPAPAYKLVGEAKTINTKKGVVAILPPLRANRSIALAFVHSYKGDKLNQFHSLNHSIDIKDKTDSIQFNKIRQTAKVDLCESPYFNTKAQNITQELTSFSYSTHLQYRNFYYRKINPILYTIEHKIENDDFLFLNNDSIKDLGRLAFKLKIDNSALVKIGAIDSLGILKFQEGLLNIESYSVDPPVDTFAFEKRIGNLNIGIKHITQIQSLVKRISISTNERKYLTEGILKDLTNLKAVLVKNKTVLEENYSKINKLIENNDSLTYVHLGIGNSNFPDLKTKGSYYVIPNIGLCYVPAIGNYDNYHMAKPYIGASVYLKPVNKNTPFRYYNNSFWYRASFNLGLSIIETKNDEFKDFYNKMSLMLGVNYKITQEISLSIGTIIMQRKDVNIAIEDYSYIPMFYTGIAFDLDFMNAISKLTSKIY